MRGLRLASRTEAPGTAEADTESYTYTIDGRANTQTAARGIDRQHAGLPDDLRV